MNLLPRGKKFTPINHLGVNLVKICEEFRMRWVRPTGVLSCAPHGILALIRDIGDPVTAITVRSSPQEA